MDDGQLKRRLKRAKELQLDDERSFKGGLIEGQLLKFTNVVKGYQARWCVIDPELGVVEYYEKESHKQLSKPRGVLNLTNASVYPSAEDPYGFLINASNGDTLKLKATDTRERQYWLDKIRAVSQYHTEKAEHRSLIAALSIDTPSTSSKPVASAHSSFSSGALQLASPNANSSGYAERTVLSAPNTSEVLIPSSSIPLFCSSGIPDPRVQLRELFRLLEVETQALASAVNSVTIRTPELTPVYKAFLLCKATSQETFSCLKRCTELIKSQGTLNVELPLTLVYNEKLNTDGHTIGECEYLVNTRVAQGAATASAINGGKAASASQPICQALTHQLGAGVFPSPILHLDSNAVELPDFPGDSQPDAPFTESELGSVENNRNILLDLLSQLTIGMDLTRIILPTFILEKRSLLEMFADYLAHPDLFLAINQGEDGESRMIAFVQWYLSSFHAGRKDQVAKKPYNPIIGECFHCCWVLPEAPTASPGHPTTSPGQSTADSHVSEEAGGPTEIGTGAAATAGPVITYCAEQVSHHPPVTAFRFHCAQQDMSLDSSIHTKSKFQSMSISVTMLGRTVLRLGKHQNEEYHFTFPTAYARSILTMPWVELCDKVSITCPWTGYSASIGFLAKPMRSNKLHRVVGEIYAPTAIAPQQLSPGSSKASDRGKAYSTLVARVTGQWNASLDFEQFTKGGRKWSVNVGKLPVTPKRIRPVDQQRPEESRRLWQPVTEALRDSNIPLVTEHKRELEKRQRISEDYRIRHRIPFPVKYFEYDGTDWVFCRRTETTTPPVPPASTKSS